jgi:hypothetical protein
VFYALLTVRIEKEVLRKKENFFYLEEHNVRLMKKEQNQEDKCS